MINLLKYKESLMKKSYNKFKMIKIIRIKIIPTRIFNQSVKVRKNKNPMLKSPEEHLTIKRKIPK